MTFENIQSIEGDELKAFIRCVDCRKDDERNLKKDPEF
jgi:hypothetical protein